MRKLGDEDASFFGVQGKTYWLYRLVTRVYTPYSNFSGMIEEKVQVAEAEKL